MKAVTPKEEMEQRNLGYFTVAVKFQLAFSSHSHPSLEGNPLVSPCVSWHKGHCYHHLPGWMFVLLQGNLWKTILNVLTLLCIWETVFAERRRLMKISDRDSLHQGDRDSQAARDSNWEVKREAETLSHGKHQFQMSLLQPKHSQNVECFLSWDEMFTPTAGSPRQRLILLECRSFCRFANHGLSVCGCSLTSPGQTQAHRSRLGTS